MREFNYSLIRDKKWDSDLLGLVAAIYKEAGKQEIAGYRDVLGIIHESFDSIPITQNYILQLHKILYSHMNNPVVGRTKTVQNYISVTYPDGHTETLFTPLALFSFMIFSASIRSMTATAE